MRQCIDKIPMKFSVPIIQAFFRQGRRTFSFDSSYPDSRVLNCQIYRLFFTIYFSFLKGAMDEEFEDEKRDPWGFLKNKGMNKEMLKLWYKKMAEMAKKERAKGRLILW